MSAKTVPVFAKHVPANTVANIINNFFIAVTLF